MTCISKGNIKVGSIPNISLPPVKSCQAETGKAPACAASCYALKAWRQYEGTRNAWGGNLRDARLFPDKYFGEISAYLTKKQPRFFRWHVSGDIISYYYLERMVALAVAHPGVKFLAFTKQTKIVNAWIVDNQYQPAAGRSLLPDGTLGFPRNLAIVISRWPGMPDGNVFNLPQAWVRPERPVPGHFIGYVIPSDALECPGRCDTCGACWGLRRDVVFGEH